ncbi:MAG: hypothetical protein NVSMB9_07600 [Isosphaeraceae bacterium]
MNAMLDRLIHLWSGIRAWNDTDDPGQLARKVVQLYEQGHFRESQETAQRLVELQRRRLGADHPDYASALTNLALLYQKQGEFVTAEPLLRDALEIRRKSLGELDPQFAASLIHLAELFQLQGSLAAAEPLMRQALEIRREAQGERHHDYATALAGRAVLRHRRGDTEGAEPLLRQALEIRKEALGDRHPMVATVLGNLGLVLQRKGDLAGAEPLLRQALEIRRETQGVRHPDYAACLSHLARLLIQRQDFEGAEPLIRQAVEIRRHALGPRHPEFLADFQTLARVRQSLSSLAEPSPAPPTPSRDDSCLAEPEPPTVGEYPVPVTPEPPAHELASEAHALAARFANASASLIHMAQRMVSEGSPPDPGVLDEASACRIVFLTLRDEAGRRARSLRLEPPPENEEAPDLRALGVLLDRVAHDEAEHPRLIAERQRLLALIDRAASLRHRNDPETSVLRECLADADALRSQIDLSRPTAPLPPDAAAFASGTHPLAALLSLIERDTTLPDHEWLKNYREVEAAYSAPLAAAAARGRIEAVPARSPLVSHDAISPVTLAARDQMPALAGGIEDPIH